MNNELVLRLTNDLNNTYNINNGDHLKLLIFNDGANIQNCHLNINLDQDASLELYNVVTTDKESSLDEIINLNKQGSKVEIINVLLAKNTKLNSRIVINHLDKLTESKFNNYAVAVGDTKIILDNNATIKKGCVGSVVNQKAKGLSLNKNAIIEAKPNLFIDEFDVIANHAASIGGLNKEDLFYLTSRGLSISEAGRLIVVGFVKPIVDRIDDEKLKEDIYNKFISLI